MKKRASILILAMAFLLSSCGAADVATSGAIQSPVPEIVQAKTVSKTKATTKKKITVTSGDKSWKIGPQGDNGELDVIHVTSMEELPTVDCDPDAKVTIDKSQKEPHQMGYTTAKELNEYAPSYDGLYTYYVTANGTTYVFDVEVDLEPAVFFVSNNKIAYEKPEVTRGEYMTLLVQYAEDAKITATSTTGYNPTFFLDRGNQIALLPASYNTNPGTYQVTVTIDGKPQTFDFTVKDREFVEQHLTVDKATASSTIESDAANQEWNEKIEPLKYTAEPNLNSYSAFIQPVSGKITTEFGMARYTNGSKTPSRHSGIDIAAPKGTPVPASNNGKVIFAGYLKLTGNTVIIEHGFGLKSWYYHMDSLNTETGTIVNQGDIIGKVGSTGFSTGPHLHYAMSVNQVFTNPWVLFESSDESSDD